MLPLVTRRIGFAHRGGRAHAPENSLRAFTLALQMGAPGLETDVWLTADSVPVLHHGAAVRRRPIAGMRADELPAWLPRLADLYATCGVEFDLSVDLKDRQSAAAVLDVARSVGHPASRIWLCGGVAGALAWRSTDPGVRLVSGAAPGDGADRAWREHLRRLRDGGIDAVNLRRRRWSAAVVDSVHEAGLLAFAWDAQSRRRIRSLLALGCDGIYSDHVDRLVAALAGR